MTWQVAADGPLRALDERIGRAAGGRLLPGPLAEFLADLGNMTVALPVLVAAAGFAGWRLRRAPGRWWPVPLAALLTMAAVPALVAPVKALTDRPAPPGPLAGSHGFYPSGHTATATVAYGAAALLLLWSRRGPDRRTPDCRSAPASTTGRAHRPVPEPDHGARSAAHGPHLGRRLPPGRTRCGPAPRQSARRPARPGRRTPVAAGSAVAVLNVGVGTGLVLRGYHWPLDVVGSWCLSVALLTVLFVVVRRWLLPRG